MKTMSRARRSMMPKIANGSVVGMKMEAAIIERGGLLRILLDGSGWRAKWKLSNELSAFVTMRMIEVKTAGLYRQLHKAFMHV